MRVLITGLRGTVGRALQARLRADAHEVVGWDREAVPIDHYDAMNRFIGEIAPDAIVNLAIASQPTGRDNEQWVVNHEWPSELAWIARERGIKFLHTSTVMVFGGQGPFTLDDVPDAPDGYGCHKRLAEARVLAQNPEAIVVRLGWQIGESAGGNNMIDYFDRQVRESGHVSASACFLPACSFLPDTADALTRALAAPPGLYMIDGNEGWSHARIARALAARFGWSVVETFEPARDERMLDPRLGVASLKSRLAL